MSNNLIRKKADIIDVSLFCVSMEIILVLIDISFEHVNPDIAKVLQVTANAGIIRAKTPKRTTMIPKFFI